MLPDSEGVRLSRRAVLGAVGLAMVPSAAGFARSVPDTRSILEQARALDQLHGIVISVDGRIVLGSAVRGPGLDTPVNVKSVAKTVMAALTGAAIERGVLDGVSQRVAPVLGDQVPANADPLVREITVEDLLTMRAGLERTSGPHYGEWVQSPNWVRHVLSRDFIDRPGGRMLYSTGSYHLLSAVITRESGRSTLALMREWLGAPLGIEIPPWTRDPQGIYMGGNNMALSPLAMIRFGEMYRRGGLGPEGRVFSGKWVDASWTPRTRSPFSGDEYGYGWFLRLMGGHAVAYARGYGGQMLYVIPGLRLTVAITSDPTRPARSEGYVGDLHRLVERQIVPLAEGLT